MLDLHATAKSTDMFEAINKVEPHYEEYDQCSCTVTDGARTLSVSEIPIAGLLKQKKHQLSLMHCIVHQGA